MNSSLWSADRTVYIKIVLVSLAAAIVILAFGNQCSTIRVELRIGK